MANFKIIKAKVCLSGYSDQAQKVKTLKRFFEYKGIPVEIQDRDTAAKTELGWGMEGEEDFE